MSPKRNPEKSGTSTTAVKRKSDGFTAEERAAMKERSRELKAAARVNNGKADGESEVLAKIAEMTEGDRAIAERVHAIVTGGAPELSPRTWYGMPAYAKDGKILCFFKPAEKFALKGLTATDEARISALLNKAVS